jgi:hypothetical protein
MGDDSIGSGIGKVIRRVLCLGVEAWKMQADSSPSKLDDIIVDALQSLLGC